MSSICSTQPKKKVNKGGIDATHVLIGPTKPPLTFFCKKQWKMSVTSAVKLKTRNLTHDKSGKWWQAATASETVGVSPSHSMVARRCNRDKANAVRWRQDGTPDTAKPGAHGLSRCEANSSLWLLPAGTKDRASADHLPPTSVAQHDQPRAILEPRELRIRSVLQSVSFCNGCPVLTGALTTGFPVCMGRAALKIAAHIHAYVNVYVHNMYMYVP